MEDVKFLFDPRCPWTYQAARWMWVLEAAGEVELEWGIFSLELAALEPGADRANAETVSGPAFRTIALIRERHDDAHVGRFYAALGKLIWEKTPPADDMIAACRSALESVGLDASLVDEAMASPATWEAVVREHERAEERTGATGLPTIALDGGVGPSITGPILTRLPKGDDAAELWRHVLWLMRYRDFSELRRRPAGPPDLPAVTWERMTVEAAAIDAELGV